MEPSSKSAKVLPQNAFRELEPGESYTPVVPADDPRPEVSARSVTIGVIMVVIFTFAAAYIGLKTGNVIETSIPIAILAVFLGTLFARRNSLLENVIIQSIGQAAGVVVAGAIFTIPALYILDLQPSFLQIFLSCLVGGYLGVVLLIHLVRLRLHSRAGEGHRLDQVRDQRRSDRDQEPDVHPCAGLVPVGSHDGRAGSRS